MLFFQIISFVVDAIFRWITRSWLWGGYRGGWRVLGIILVSGIIYWLVESQCKAGPTIHSLKGWGNVPGLVFAIVVGIGLFEMTKPKR